MNTFSENGNDFVGRLLHEGGVRRRTFFAFSQYQKCQYGMSIHMHIQIHTDTHECICNTLLHMPTYHIHTHTEYTNMHV